MASDIANLELGPCQVWYGAAGAEADQGYSMGGVTLNIPMQTADLKADQLGDAPVNQVIIGQGPVEVEVPLAELTFANIVAAVPGAALITDGATPTKTRVQFVAPIGTDLVSLGKSLILKKIVAGVVSTDEDDWLTVPLAAPVTEVNQKYDASSQRVLTAKFRGFPTTVGIYTNVLAFLGARSAVA
jgi:hypothetical protein